MKLRLRVSKNKTNNWKKGESCVSNPKNNQHRSHYTREVLNYKEKNNHILFEKLDECLESIQFKHLDLDFYSLVDHAPLLLKIIETLKSVLNIEISDNIFSYLTFCMDFISDDTFTEEYLEGLLVVTYIFVSSKPIEPSKLPFVMKKMINLLQVYQEHTSCFAHLLRSASAILKTCIPIPQISLPFFKFCSKFLTHHDQTVRDIVCDILLTGCVSFDFYSYFSSKLNEDHPFPVLFDIIRVICVSSVPNIMEKVYEQFMRSDLSKKHLIIRALLSCDNQSLQHHASYLLVKFLSDGFLENGEYLKSYLSLLLSLSKMSVFYETMQPVFEKFLIESVVLSTHAETKIACTYVKIVKRLFKLWNFRFSIETSLSLIDNLFNYLNPNRSEGNLERVAEMLQILFRNTFAHSSVNCLKLFNKYSQLIFSLESQDSTHTSNNTYFTKLGCDILCAIPLPIVKEHIFLILESPCYIEGFNYLIEFVHPDSFDIYMSIIKTVYERCNFASQETISNSFRFHECFNSLICYTYRFFEVYKDYSISMDHMNFLTELFLKEHNTRFYIIRIIEKICIPSFLDGPFWVSNLVKDYLNRPENEKCNVLNALENVISSSIINIDETCNYVRTLTQDPIIFNKIYAYCDDKTLCKNLREAFPLTKIPPPKDVLINFYNCIRPISFSMQTKIKYTNSLKIIYINLYNFVSQFEDKLRVPILTIMKHVSLSFSVDDFCTFLPYLCLSLYNPTLKSKRLCSYIFSCFAHNKLEISDRLIKLICQLSLDRCTAYGALLMLQVISNLGISIVSFVNVLPTLQKYAQNCERSLFKVILSVYSKLVITFTVSFPYDDALNLVINHRKFVKPHSIMRKINVIISEMKSRDNCGDQEIIMKYPDPVRKILRNILRKIHRELVKTPRNEVNLSPICKDSDDNDNASLVDKNHSGVMSHASTGLNESRLADVSDSYLLSHSDTSDLTSKDDDSKNLVNNVNENSHSIGHEYKALKAGGDCIRKDKPEPYAFIPLTYDKSKNGRSKKFKNITKSKSRKLF